MEKENEKVLASGPKGDETAAGENSNYGTELQKGGGRDELEEREEVEKPPPSPFFYSSKQTPPLGQRKDPSEEEFPKTANYCRTFQTLQAAPLWPAGAHQACAPCCERGVAKTLGYEKQGMMQAPCKWMQRPEYLPAQWSYGDEDAAAARVPHCDVDRCHVSKAAARECILNVAPLKPPLCQPHAARSTIGTNEEVPRMQRGKEVNEDGVEV
ncbi:unnamed protein product [Pleuronectes platessa]|uniref:Uncharacterized protein n=1 Tax=Pleuronectes platessa TaxID=8262 RepID=A0A9N7Z2K1_PLEPL|nr:unnamed protein product [Pleuronectes platessa]